MGRYYSGDIEGKFWFGVQPSNDASFFGGEELEPNYIEYAFYEEDLNEIKEGIKECEKKLGQYKKRLKTFFETTNGYNTEMLKTQLNIPIEKTSELLEWYARLELGEKILKCVQKNKECIFQAEL